MHGYEICKHYMKIYPKASARAIYYSLSKGVKSGHFKIAKVEIQKGSYSWGPEAQRIYYTLGTMAKPSGDAKAKKYFEQARQAAPKKPQD